MTDIKTHLSGAFGDEPPLVDDLDAIMTSGRRAARRRTAVTAVAGTAGAAALTAAVVVPIMTVGSNGGHSTRVAVETKPTPPAPPCKMFMFVNAHHNLPTALQAKRSLVRQHVKFVKIIVHKTKNHSMLEVAACPTKDSLPPPVHHSTADSGPTGPKYRYTEDPQHISDRLAAKLAADASADHFTVVYSRPFAQETSTLEPGHPGYYDGNVDVQVGSTLGDIGVQVNHQTTTQQAFDGTCDGSGFADCQRTTLPDGSVLETENVRVSHGEYIVEAQVSRTDGTVVQVQESNYGFGPEATRAHGDQPLPLSALVSMAEDPAYSF